MTLTQKTVLNYCNENGLVIRGWNFYDESIQDLVFVKDMPSQEERKGALAFVEDNPSGIETVNCFYTTRNIKNSYPRLRTCVNGKWVNVKR